MHSDTTRGRPPRVRPSRSGLAAPGRFVLRIAPALHERLRAQAREAGISLNDYCARKLTATGCEPSNAAAVVERAQDVFGKGLVGVVAFGSWVRGDAGSGSDVDVMVVLQAAVALTRALYRRWDEQPLTWGGYPVEAHFVHLPQPGDVAGGVWAEVALDSVVLFERQLLVSRALSAVRRHILSGRLVRRVVHGQPYWTEVA
jgi:hypothetical protein